MAPFAFIGLVLAIKTWQELPEATKRYLIQVEQIEIRSGGVSVIRKSTEIVESNWFFDWIALRPIKFPQIFNFGGTNEKFDFDLDTDLVDRHYGRDNAIQFQMHIWDK